jgi:hypothetical protein
MKRTKSKKINIYRWINKHKKKIVSAVCILIVMSLLFGLFAQLFYMPNTF